MELGMSKLNTGYLVEELAAKQPLSISHLRQYLAPSAIPSRPSSGGSAPRRRSSPNAMGSGSTTLVAAAARAKKDTVINETFPTLEK